MPIEKENYGLADGQTVYLYLLSNRNGMKMTCLNYGCAITSLFTPDRRGNYENVILGFADLAGYQENVPCAGVVVGRVAGRIREAAFELAGTTYRVTANSGRHHLHGGHPGFSHVVWQSESFQQQDRCGVRFAYTSPDGEAGYPGTLAAQVTYTLTDTGELIIEYQAQSDKDTLFVPTNHMYFNLSGGLKRDILQHTLRLNSSRFTELDADSLPTGRLLEVTGTVFDFRQGRVLADGTVADHPQSRLVKNGYDHAFALDGGAAAQMELCDAASGRILLVHTDAPCVVVYTGNQLSDTLVFTEGHSRRYLGICLETQGFPDAIHHPQFPSVVLPAGQLFRSTTTYAFRISQ